MARTKQTARKSSGGKAPRRMLATKNAHQLRQYLTARQTATYATAKPSEQKKTSYINYENMFYSYYFPTGVPCNTIFDPRFISGAGKHPISGKSEKWLGMSFNSKYDGPGMKVHGRPHLNLSIVLDVSGSMGSLFEQDHSSNTSVCDTKLDVAKKCLQTLTDQLTPRDRFGLVRFNHEAVVHCPMQEWKSVKKTALKQNISQLRPNGLTCLSAAIDCATNMFSGVSESGNSTSRVIFLTDLCSTMDSVNDERKLLSTIKRNAQSGIYTTVVGIGMDLNVRLVEEISKTAGAKYCSVDSSHEFQQIMNDEFDYDTTILAFDIRLELESQHYQLVKGYGSPELNAVKPGKPVLISSEFPSWQNEQGESKGGMLLFKMEEKKGKKNPPPKEVKVKVSWRGADGMTRDTVVQVKLNDKFEDVGTRKAALIVHYVDLQNDYVHDRRQNKVKFLEMFQTFRDHFKTELTEMADNSFCTYNKGDVELLDKIIALEENPDSSSPATTSAVRFSSSVTTFGGVPSFGGASTFGGRWSGPRPRVHQQTRKLKRLGRPPASVVAGSRRRKGGKKPMPRVSPKTTAKATPSPASSHQAVGTRRSSRIASQTVLFQSTLAPSVGGRKRKASSSSDSKDLGPPAAKRNASTAAKQKSTAAAAAKKTKTAAVKSAATSRAKKTVAIKDKKSTVAAKKTAVIRVKTSISAGKKASTSANPRVTAAATKQSQAKTKKTTSTSAKRASTHQLKKTSTTTKKKASTNVAAKRGSSTVNKRAATAVKKRETKSTKIFSKKNKKYGLTKKSKTRRKK